jgi:inorganic pyrophosphatase
MSHFARGFTDELVKLANVTEQPLPATASYRSDTRHFGAPEPGGPQGSGGDLVGPDGKARPDHEAPGDSPGPVKVANDPIQKRVTVGGMKISIEWPKGSKRKYMDKKDPKKVNYEKLMKADYGYIPGTKDNDNEQLDIYVGPDPKSEKVFVIKQLKDDGSFDERKIMMGYPDLDAAKKSYLDHMPPKRLGQVTETSLEAFKKLHLPRAKKQFRKAASDDLIKLFTAKETKKKVVDQDDETGSAADAVDEPTPGMESAQDYF